MLSLLPLGGKQWCRLKGNENLSRLYQDKLHVGLHAVSLMESFEPGLVDRPLLGSCPFSGGFCLPTSAIFLNLSIQCKLFMLACMRVETRLDHGHCLTLVLKHHWKHRC